MASRTVYVVVNDHPSEISLSVYASRELAEKAVARQIAGKLDQVTDSHVRERLLAAYVTSKYALMRDVWNEWCLDLADQLDEPGPSNYYTISEQKVRE